MKLLAGLSLNQNNQRLANLIVVAGMTLAAATGFTQTLCAQPEAAGAAIMAIEEKPADAGAKATFSGRQAQGKSVTPHTVATSKRQPAAAKPPVAVPVRTSGTRSTSTEKDDGFIVGDKYTFLNFEIASKVQPIWTIKAKNAGASGLVQVEVLIDKNGSVLTAKARIGNVLLHPEAERAAMATKFNHPTLYNKPVKAMGFVVYRFGKSEEDDDN